MQIHDTTLDGAIEQIAAYLSYPADALHEFAADDPHPKMGWDNGKGEAPVGCSFSVEGQVLYALVRAMQPQHVLELGTSAGSSTTHLAAAVVAVGKGKVTTIDARMHGNQGFETGYLVPAGLRSAVRFVTQEGLNYLASVADGSVPFIFEDMMHGPEEVEAVWTHALRILPPGGVIVSHDAAHYIVGEGVRQGIRAALNKHGHEDMEPLVMKIAPGDTGLAVWKKPLSARDIVNEVARLSRVPQNDLEDALKASEQEPEWQTTEQPSSETTAAKSAPPRRGRPSSASKSKR